MPKLPAPPIPGRHRPKPQPPSHDNGKPSLADQALEAGTSAIGWVDKRTSLSSAGH